MKFKPGFSLIELLIVMAIISVITVMGLNISKKGVDSAYNLYFYTAYTSMENAISEILIRQGDNAINASNIASELGCEISNNIISCKNGVRYSIRDISLTINQTTYNDSKEIIIAIPAPRRVGRNQFLNNGIMAYVKDSDKEFVMPLPPTANELSQVPYVDLMHRKDLIPFFIDDGIVGRVTPNRRNENGELEIFEPRRFYNYAEAFCRTNGQALNDFSSSTNDNNRNVSFCSNIPNPEGAIRGVIKPENPRKVF